jgi:hypothetical protein
MAKKAFRLVARISTDSSTAVRPVLEKLMVGGKVKGGSSADEFLVEARMIGEGAKELNRSLLSSLRRVEKRTRLRAEWTYGDTTERFFDYVSKGAHKKGSQP